VAHPDGNIFTLFRAANLHLAVQISLQYLAGGQWLLARRRPIANNSIANCVDTKNIRISHHIFLHTSNVAHTDTSKVICH
jgi:hypothetical protein